MDNSPKCKLETVKTETTRVATYRDLINKEITTTLPSVFAVTATSAVLLKQYQVNVQFVIDNTYSNGYNNYQQLKGGFNSR